MIGAKEFFDNKVEISGQDLMRAMEQAIIIRALKDDEEPSTKVIDSIDVMAIDVFRIMIGDLKVPKKAEKVRFRIAKKQMCEMLKDLMDDITEVLGDDTL